MKFIKYFDFLGFGDFIRNNDLEVQQKVMSNIFRDIEFTLSKGESREGRYGLIAELLKLKLNCINFSDTIIIWSNDTSDESLKDIMDITYNFNWKANLYFFPVRGTLTMGELEEVDFSHRSDMGGKYNLNSVYGKGLIEAHEIAESQEWAGTILSPKVVDFINKTIREPEAFLNLHTKPYLVPLKTGNEELRVFNLIKGELNNTAFLNYESGLRKNFKAHNKSIESDSVAEKLENTIGFLSSYRNFKPSPIFMV